jgi:hypothetical protein
VKEDGRDVLAGRLQILYVDMENAVNDGHDPYLLLYIDKATAEFKSFYRGDGEFSRPVQRAAREIIGRNLMIVDRVEILPGFRGQKLGLECIHRAIRLFASLEDLVALRSIPLQFVLDQSASRDAAA